MGKVFKILYITLTPVAIILIYEEIKTPWVAFLSSVQALSALPGWSFLAFGGGLYAVNVWMLIGSDRFDARQGRRRKLWNGSKTAKTSDFRRR